MAGLRAGRAAALVWFAGSVLTLLAGEYAARARLAAERTGSRRLLIAMLRR